MNNENRHLIYDVVNDYFYHWLNEIEGVTEIAVNRPGEIFIKVRGKWQWYELLHPHWPIFMTAVL